MKITRSRLKQIIREEMDAMASAVMDDSPQRPVEELVALANKAAAIHGYLQALSESPDPDPICAGVEDAVTEAYASMLENECEVG
tara:strand:+ start:2744 stop:2998 length:255 start_codon:yes stop_codon:yes gene_type:complete